MKLDFQEQSVRFIAKSLTLLIISLCLLATLLFLSLGLSALFNQLLDSAYWGYMIVAGLYLIIGVSFFLSKNKIEEKLLEEVKDSGILEEPEEENEQ